MDTCEENIGTSTVTADTSTIDGALPEDSESNAPSTLDKTVEIADNDKSEPAISDEKEFNIKSSREPDDENLEKQPEQIQTPESHNSKTFQIETNKVEDDDDEELELRWDDDDDFLTDHQNNDATDIGKSAGLKDINTDEKGAGDAGIEGTKMVNEESSKSDILAENNDTNESCNDIDMDTEDKLLEEIDDSIEIDKTPISDLTMALEDNVKIYDVELAKDSESFAEEQKSESDKPETIDNKEETVMQVDKDNVINDETEIDLHKNETKLSDDVNIDVNPDNEESMDISIEMEDNLLKDDDLGDNHKIESAVMSVDSQIAEVEKDISVLVDNKNDAVDVEAAVIEKCYTDNIASKDTIKEPSTIDDSNNLPPTVESDVKKSNHEIAQVSSPKTLTHDISLNDSRLRIKTDHALSKPDAMLEIPTQELIDIDDFDESLDSNQSIDTEQEDKTEIREDESAKDNIINEQANDMETGNENVEKALIVAAIDKPNVSRKNTNDLDLIAVETKVNEETYVKLSETVPGSTDDVQPSTSAVPSSKMSPDESAEVPDVSDSLGLLAEASGRVMDDDEEPEDDDEADNDDDFDQEDESSNPMTTAEHSEDSNPQHSDSEAPKDQESPSLDNAVGEFQFESETPVAEVKEMDVDEVECIEDVAGISLTNEIQLIDDENGDDLTAEATEDEATKIEKTDGLVDDQVDIETVKLSDTSDNEAEVEMAVEAITDNKPAEVDNEVVNEKEASSISAPVSPSSQAVAVDDSKQSPSKKKLKLSQGIDQPIFNIVDLDDSDEEIKVTKKDVDSPKPAPEDSDVTSVNLPKEIEVMATSAGSTSDIVTKEGEVIISGVPKATPIKSTGFRLNTSELSIKTSSSISESSIVIPETKISECPTKEVSDKPKMGLEIFSLDSDEEDNVTPVAQTSLLKEKTPAPKPKTPEPERPPPPKCINSSCKSGADTPRMVADAAVATHYGAGKKRKATVCTACAEAVDKKAKDLIIGMKDFVPLLELCGGKVSEDLVEISDSEDEEDTAPDSPPPPAEKIGHKAAKLLEENLASMLNATWLQYKMDDRIVEAELALEDEFSKLEEESEEIDRMFNECQVATDKLRNELYAAFEQEKLEEQPIVIFDTPTQYFTGLEANPEDKRQLMPCTIYASDSPAKKAALPLKNTTQVDTSQIKQEGIQPASTVDSFKTETIDDDKDVSVVKLSAESAPSWLPPLGELIRAPLRVGMSVVAIMRNTFGRWLQAKIVEVLPRSNSQFTSCRVKFEHKLRNPCRLVSGRGLAYINPPNARLVIGTRIIALFKDENTGKRESYYSGVVSEIPNPVNNYRYLVFFDDGYAQYVEHNHTRLVCETSSLVWEEVHPFSREFVREYLMAYPERPMVRLHEGQSLRTEWNGKWWNCKVLRVDASLAQILFLDEGRKEWIYRGSTRLAPLFLELKAAERHRQRPMPRSKAQTRTNMPYVEYTRSDEQSDKQQDTQQQQTEDMRRQRAVAKKSTVPVPLPPATAPSAAPQQQNLDTITSRVVYYTPKNAVRPYKMTPHNCSPKCKRTDVLSLKDLRTYNPLAKPLLSGWERQIVRFKGHKEVMYRAPCGRRVRSLRELHYYLRLTNSELPVDLFDFYPGTHCLAEFVLNKCLVGKKDLSHGKENVPVPCVNYYDESLPEFCSYNTERTPTAGVPLNLDPEFLCGCDCTDDCLDKTKCACWQMTLEGARTIGLEGEDIGYEYRRLPEPLPSGIYECNSRCKCKNTCLNRVAQHPLQLKLQVFKTLNRGWGIRALNDVPKGAFLCVYAGNLLTDATANLDGLNEGDEYLAELDYIEVVEQMKEGYEEDIPEADKRLDKKELGKHKQAAEEEEEEELPSSDDEDTASKNEKEDDDFHPGYLGSGVMEFSKRLRRREKAAKEEEEKKEEKKKEKDKDGDDCITISDDEEVREPSRFMVQTGMGGNEFISKYKSVRALFGKDEACYIMDAKVQGNIGRYLNHSCTPNVFVQNVFVDTHDPRFPWVAFFALSHIKAGTELTWNYNYDVGSVPGKVLYCYCGAPNCRGRLL